MVLLCHLIFKIMNSYGFHRNSIKFLMNFSFSWGIIKKNFHKFVYPQKPLRDRTAAADANTIARATMQAREDAERAKEHAVAEAEAEMEKMNQLSEDTSEAMEAAKTRGADGGTTEPREEKADAVMEEAEDEKWDKTEERAAAYRKQPPPAEEVPSGKYEFTTEQVAQELQQKPKMQKSGQVGPCVHHEEKDFEQTPTIPKNRSQFGVAMAFVGAEMERKVYKPD